MTPQQLADDLRRELNATGFDNTIFSIKGYLDDLATNIEKMSGGSSTWVGPFPFSAADYNPALGSGWDGILIDLLGYVLPIGGLIVGAAFKIKTRFTLNSSVIAPYVGTLAGDDYELGRANLENDPSAQLYAMTAGVGSGIGVLIDATISQVWLDSFVGNPGAVGEADLYLNIALPVAP